MKKLLYIFSFAFVVACSSDDDTPEGAVESAITQLDASGTVSDQTVAEAKKTIFGRWDFASSGKSVSSAKANTCAFDFIEFTDDDYIMGLSIEGESGTVFGSYVVNDDASGNAESVDLNFNFGTSEVTIATLTNIVVVESGNNLNATFDINLSIPDDEDLGICNNLSGDYSATKDEPMDESSSASADTNHAKLVNTWNVDSFVLNGEDGLTEFKIYPCLADEDSGDVYPDCTPATSVSLSFSTFGSYSTILLGSSEGTAVEFDSWAWADSSQTTFYVGEGDERLLVTINSLTSTSASLTDAEGAIITLSR